MYEDNNTTFVMFCFVLRISWALGCTAIIVAVYSKAANEFTGDTSIAMVRVFTMNICKKVVACLFSIHIVYFAMQI